jgi:hypothetical protein
MQMSPTVHKRFCDAERTGLRFERQWLCDTPFLEEWKARANDLQNAVICLHADR